MTSRSTVARRDWAVVLFWLAALIPPIAFTWKILTAGRMWFVNRVPDDAFYYLEIAQRLARGQGATVDGLHQTNGFHPLWQIIEAGLAVVLHGWALVRTAFLVQVILFVAALYVVNRLIRPLIGDRASAFAVMIASFWCTSVAINGMESAVLILAGSLLGLAVVRADEARSRTSFLVVGVALAGVTLARLDFGIPIALLAIPALIWRWRSVTSVGTVIAGGAITAAPYVVWALVVIGHLLPVSGFVKQRVTRQTDKTRYGGELTSGYSKHLLDLIHHYSTTVLWPPFGTVTNLALMGVAVIGVYLVFINETKRTTRSFVLLLLAALVVVKALTDLIVTPLFAEHDWYTLPERFAIAITVGAFGWQALRRIDRGVWAVGVALLVVIGMTPHSLPKDKQLPPVSAAYQATNMEVADWIKYHGPVGIYGSTDGGALAFVTDKKAQVVNLDGLVNSYDYANRLAKGQAALERYQSQNVRYLIGQYDPTNRKAVPACASLLAGPFDVPSMGSLVTVSSFRIWDLAACSSN